MKHGIPWNWPEEKRKVGQLIGLWPLAGGEEKGQGIDEVFLAGGDDELGDLLAVGFLS